MEVIDIAQGEHYVGDISKKEVLEAFAKYVINKHGHVDILINNALPVMRGIDDCSYEEFETESYTAAKGGIAALTHAMAVSLAGVARVNSISPGWIETGVSVYKGADASQQLVGRVGNTRDIANMILFLCSDKAGFISGEIFDLSLLTCNIFIWY